MNRRSFVAASAPILAGCLTPLENLSGKDVPVRFGHFPNITHVQALVARQLSRQGKGWFESRVGLPIEWYSYNAGPEAVLAIFGGALDVTYIGPSPVLNGFSRSKGKEVRVLAGAVNGGNALMVRPGAMIKTAEDFRGKRVASPQLGNTQDVQLRSWLAQHGLKTTLTGGGDVSIQPTQNPDQLTLFQSGNLDAAWTVEPWVTRLEREAGAHIFLDDKETNVTLLAARARFLSDRAEAARKIVAAHLELTEWIKNNEAETKKLMQAELKALTGKEPPLELIDAAFARVVITSDISQESLQRMVGAAQSAGLLKDIPDLKNLITKL